MRKMTTLLSSMLLVSAQPGRREASPVTSPVSAVASVDTTAIAVLRAQNAEIRENQDRLLATVYWSLGTVGLLVTVVVGFSAYLNLRLYDRDKKALEQSLRGMASEQTTSLERRLVEQQRAFEGEVRSQAAAAGEVAVLDVRKALLRSIDDLRDDLRYLQMDVLDAEARPWREQKVYGNEVGVQIKMLELAHEMSWEGRTGAVLDGIEAALKNGARLDAQDISELFAALERLPSHFAPVIGRIRKRIESPSERGANEAAT